MVEFFIFLIVLVSVVIAYTWRYAPEKLNPLVRWFLPKRFVKPREKNEIGYKEQKKVVERVFKLLNIEATSHSEAEETVYRFDFQSGHFSLTCPKGTSRGMRLIYPGFATVPLDSIDCVRIVCNDVSNRSPFVFAMYMVNEETNQVTAHLAARLAPTTDAAAFERDFKLSAADCFGLHRYASERLEYLMEKSQKFHISDFEYHAGCEDAVEHILLETENWHTKQQYGLWRMAEGCERQLCVKNLLRHLLTVQPGRITRLEATAYNYSLTIVDEKEILNYVVATPLVGQAPDGEKVKDFRSQRAVIFLQVEQFDPAEERPDGVELGIYLMLNAVKRTEENLFFRLTYTMPQHIATRTESRTALEAIAQPCSGSLLLSYDLVEEPRKRAEFRYMMLDAQDKYAEGKGSECSQEQELILNLSDPDSSYDAYWGNRLMREGLFLEASLRLERAWNALNERYTTLGKRQRDAYYRISYLLGVCLSRLGAFKEAYYYLRLIEHEHNSDYLQALINCMVALKDPRALDMVRNAMHPLRERIHEMECDEEEVPTYFTDLLNFLRRREIYIEIERGYLDEAEKLCKAMLNEPENSDYALSELAHLQKLRNSGVQSRDPSIEDIDFPF